jgi:hypothetical protein
MNTIGKIGNMDNIKPGDYEKDKLTNNEETLKDTVKNSVEIKDSVDVNEKKEKMDNKVGTKNEENSRSKKFITGVWNSGLFTTGGWNGGLFRIADLANKVAPFTVRFAGAISFLAGLGAFFNFLDGIVDVASENVYRKIDGVIDLASVAAWGAGVLGSISAPVGLAIVGGLYGAKIINYAIAKHNENKQR